MFKLDGVKHVYYAYNLTGFLIGKFENTHLGGSGSAMIGFHTERFTRLTKWRDAIYKHYGESNIRLETTTLQL